ncbi:endonuclease V [Orbus wheelerorum]|uniref:endonuclease V n=1 Tax=Orbus wheelerorum TaxID=3074111 RepID=UPI00370D2452
MILAIDVYYIDDKAKSVGILFNGWQDETPFGIIADYRDNIAPYQSGEFYLRELPCIMSLLEKIDLSKVDIIVVDGHVYLDDGKIGLGGHLYQALNQSIPIIGIAKNPFFTNNNQVKEVFRGNSKHPLYITSVGIDAELAASNVRAMAGKHRMPTLLSFLDQQTKLFKSE